MNQNEIEQAVTKRLNEILNLDKEVAGLRIRLKDQEAHGAKIYAELEEQRTVIEVLEKLNTDLGAELAQTKIEGQRLKNSIHRVKELECIVENLRGIVRKQQEEIVGLSTTEPVPEVKKDAPMGEAVYGVMVDSITYPVALAQIARQRYALVTLGRHAGSPIYALNHAFATVFDYADIASQARVLELIRQETNCEVTMELAYDTVEEFYADRA